MLQPDKEQSHIALKEERGQRGERKRGREEKGIKRKKGMVSYSEDAL